ncbi:MULTISPECIES: acyltransferase [unclassified Clostridium]|uniref:acyltransferase family protein n=1 Tax=unclassified Clostridium TaxID=2614128 RepID=UPI002079C968|nr:MULTISPECIES: acyltransferase [unclassified Clostridium]
MELKRLSVLDSLRGLAAIGIAFFWHYQHFNPQNGYPFSGKAYWFYNYGWSLVDFFFVLSGFIFCYVYKKRIKNHELSFKKYAILRFSRLYPLLFITLIFVTTIQSLRMLLIHNFFVYPNNDVYHFLMNLFCIQSGWFESGFSFNGPTWSISCEIVAYVLFYIFIYKLHENRKYIFAYIGMVFLGLFIVKTGINYPLFNGNMERVFIGFFIGCFVYEFNNFINVSKYKNKIILLCTAILLGVTISSSIWGNVILGNWTVVYTVLIYPLIILVALNVSVVNSILSIRPISYLGDLSYSIYLWHFPVQLSINTIDKIFNLNFNYSSKHMFFTFVFITIIVSILSYELIEKTVNKNLRKKLLK